MDMPTRVFISYSHDSADHIVQMRKLADRLRAEGVDAMIDSYVKAPPQGWPRWMSQEIAKAEFVLVVCTEVYQRRFNGEEAPGVGLGGAWETTEIINAIYKEQGRTEKFIPVVATASDKDHVPSTLFHLTRYQLDREKDYRDLYERLTKQTASGPPPIGSIIRSGTKKLPPLSEKGVQSPPAALMSKIVSNAMWEKARWGMVFDGSIRGVMPIFGLGFENRSAGRAIFRAWQDRFGQADIDEELRISIINGHAEGAPPGYWIHLSTSLDGAKRRLNRLFPNSPHPKILIWNSRVLRVEESNGGLSDFKEQFARSGRYLLVPGWIDGQWKLLSSDERFGIEKRSIVFRPLDAIKNDISDPDYPVLGGDWSVPMPNRPTKPFGTS